MNNKVLDIALKVDDKIISVATEGNLNEIELYINRMRNFFKIKVEELPLKRIDKKYIDDNDILKIFPLEKEDKWEESKYLVLSI